MYLLKMKEWAESHSETIKKGIIIAFLAYGIFTFGNYFWWVIQTGSFNSSAWYFVGENTSLWIKELVSLLANVCSILLVGLLIVYVNENLYDKLNLKFKQPIITTCICSLIALVFGNFLFFIVDIATTAIFYSHYLANVFNIVGLLNRFVIFPIKWVTGYAFIANLSSIFDVSGIGMITSLNQMVFNPIYYLAPLCLTVLYSYYRMNKDKIEVNYLEKQKQKEEKKHVAKVSHIVYACPKCGVVVSKTDKFCQKCGCDLEKETLIEIQK